MSALAAPNPRPENSKWGLFGKVARMVGDYMYLRQPTVTHNSRDAFYLGCSREGVIPARQSVIIGPLRFLPQSAGGYNATLYIKNNHTFIEEVKFIGRAEVSTVSVSTPDKPAADLLEFVVSSEDVISQLTTASSNNRTLDLAFTYDIVLTNTGKLPVNVKDILLNGHSCSAFGITISDCSEEITLGPGRSHLTQLTFKPNLQQETTQVTLLVVTDRGFTEAKAEFRVGMEVFEGSSHRTYRSHNWTKTELLVVEVVVLISLSVGYAVMLLLLIENLKFDMARSEAELKKRLAENELRRKERADQLKKVQVQPVIISEVVKPVEFKKRAKPRPKASKVSVSFVKEPARGADKPLDAPACDATLLPSSATPKHFQTNSNQSTASVQVRRAAPKRFDSESKDSDASTCYQAGFTTPPSEEETTEDVFVDTYKFKALFAGPSTDVISLAELLRD
jgi:hypothetical protein